MWTSVRQARLPLIILALVAGGLFVVTGWPLIGLLVIAGLILALLIDMWLSSFILLVTIPALLGLAAGFLLAVPIWQAPLPRWTGTGDDLGPVPCNSIVSPVADQIASEIADPGKAAVSSAQATEVAENMMARANGMHKPFQGGPLPRLLSATFPDGQTRMAWQVTRVIREGSAGFGGILDIAYIDGSSQQPLMLFTDVVTNSDLVGEQCALFTISNTVSQALFLTFFLDTLLTGYLVLLTVINGVRLILKLRTARV